MYWIVVALLWMVIWAALARLRVCGAHDWERMYVCTGTYLFYPHSDDWYIAESAPLEVFPSGKRWSRGPHPNHVWTKMEVLDVIIWRGL